MPFCRIGHPRKVHHRLFFDRKESNSGWKSFEQTAMFQAKRVDSTSRFPDKNMRKALNSVSPNGLCFYSGKDSVIAREKMQQTTRQKSSVDYDGKWQRKQRTPEELEIRKRNIEQILKRRRNGICSEVERSWFTQGAYLEKHRHNLKVTQDLISRGFLYPWCWSVYLLYLFAVLFRHVFYG